MKWFKFYGQDWMTDLKIMKLSIEDRLCYLTLLCLASSSEELGVIKECNEEAIIQLTHLYNDPYESDNEYTRAIGCLKRFVDNAMITNDNGTVVIIAFHRRQNSNLSGYERIKRYREKNKEMAINKDIKCVINDNADDNADDNPRLDKIRLDKIRLDKINKGVSLNQNKEEQLKEEITKNFMYYYDDIKTIRKNKYKHKIDIVQKSMLIKVGLLWIDLVSKRLGLKKEEVPVLNIYFPIRACWDRNPNWEYNDFKDLFIYFLNDKIKDEDKISFDLCLSEKYTAKFKINKKNKKITNASMAGEIKL